MPFGDRNLLWDCISLLDDATVDGGRASAAALAGDRDLAPALLLVDGRVERTASTARSTCTPPTRKWVMRPDPAIRHWEGETLELGDGLTLIRGGGHFAGGTMLHRADGAARC